MVMERQATFEQLAKLPLVRKFERAFRKATGVALKLVPAGTPANAVPLGAGQSGFCRLVSGHRAVEEACWKAEAGAQRRVAQTLAPQTIRCFAGLNVVAAPVVVGGRHVATWFAGSVFCRPPTLEDFEGLARQLEQWGMNHGLRGVKAAFFGSRVVPAEQLRAMRQLLTLFAQHLGEAADRSWVVPRRREPQCVAQAREFVQAHLAERLGLRQVAAAVHVSPFHFCRVFRAATGLTLTEYVSRVRVDRARTLLADPTVRVSEVAYAAGFGSIAQFNTVFRRVAGKSPTEYRKAPARGARH
jgi:AraC-like DNA-binding protein/ligand-binding sensor protein